MKKIYLIFTLLVLLLTSCYKDLGNYDYRDATEVAPGEISNVEKSYTVVSFNRLQIQPDIENEKSDYDYSWFARRTSGAIISTEENVYPLGNEKNLDCEVRLQIGTYLLVLEVRDPEYNTKSFTTATLTVTSEFSVGWYILKDKDNVTDIDFAKPDGTVNHNILSALHNDPLPGKAIATALHAGHYRYEVESPDGTVSYKSGQTVVFVASSNDLHVYDANTMECVKKIDNLFFGVPDVINIQSLFVEWQGIYCINNYKMHKINMLDVGVGMFGYHLPGDYELAPFAMTSSYNGCFYFDMKNRSFKGLKSNSSAMLDLKDTETQVISCNNMDYDMVFMQEREYANKQGNSSCLGIMKSRSTGEYYAFRTGSAYASGDNPFLDFKKIPEGKKILDATTYGVNSWNSEIYFSTGDNKISYYSIANESETALNLDVPADEKINYIRQLAISGEPSMLAVGTEKDGKWKLYLYDFVEYTSAVEGRRLDEPFTGDGTLRHVRYRNTNSSYSD